MRTPLADFDFTVLDDPEFKEDSVREEIIQPILKALGYRATGKNRIVRSRQLEHPYVMIGSTKQKLRIIPDYVLYARDRIEWVLDAKSPVEPVDDSDHVAQVYSYSIHRDIRVTWFALCNGREFALYNVADTSNAARLRFKIAEIDKHWNELQDYLAPFAVSSQESVYLKDFGFLLEKVGIPHGMELVFLDVPVARVGRLFENLYNLQASVELEGSSYAACFDFRGELLPKLLAAIPEGFTRLLAPKLKRHPVGVFVEAEQYPTVTVHARRGREIQENDKEFYIPLEVLDFR